MKRIMLLLAVLMALAVSCACAEFRLPSQTKVIGEEAFAGLQLESIVLPEHLERIESRAFAGNLMKQVVLPASLTFIAEDAFEGCPLESVIAVAGSYAYQWASTRYTTVSYTPLTDFTFRSKDDGTCEIYRYNGSASAVYVPSANADGLAVTTIGSSAFQGNETLEKVVLPEGVTTIGGSAFSGCRNLGEIVIPSTLTYIGNNAFGQSGTNLASPLYLYLPDHVSFLDTLYAFGKYVPVCGFDTQTAHTLSEKYASFATPEYLECRFRYNSDGLYLNDYVGTAEALDIPEGVVVISTYAFEDNTTLKRVTIPEGVTTLLYGAFYECVNLEQISLPSTLTHIRSHAFYRAGYDLEEPLVIALPDNVSYLENGAFTVGMQNQILTCRLESVTAQTLSDCKNSFALPGELDWRYCFVDGELHLVKYAGADAEVTVPSIVSAIDSGAFSKIDSLTKVIVPESVSTIGDRVFSNCANLAEVRLPESITSLGCAFDNSSSHEKPCLVYMPSALTGFSGSLGSYVLPLCGMTSVTARNLGTNRFTESELLDWRFYYLDGKLHLSEYLGSERSVSIPTGVEVISYPGFLGNKEIVHVHIPEGVVEIRVESFLGCNNLSSIDLPQSLRTIGSKAFSSIAGTNGDPLPIFLPDGIVEVAKDAFTSSYSCLMCGLGTETSHTLSAAGFTFIDPGMPDWRLQYLEDRLCAQNYLGSASVVYVPDGIEIFNASLSSSKVTDVYFPSSVTEIRKSIDRSIRIHAETGSYAETYASQNRLEFIPTNLAGDFTYAEVDGGVMILGSIRSVDTLALPRDLGGLPVVAVAPEAFMGRGDLSQINFNCTALEEIGERAFSAIPGIVRAYLPKSVRQIGNEAFCGDAALEYVRIGAGTEWIGDRAFADCPSLVSVFIPASVTSISDSAFDGHGSGLVIYGTDGSYAEAYANAHGIPFNDLSNDAYCLYDELVAVNAEDMTVTLGPRTLPLADDVSINRIVKMWVESTDKRVLCYVEDGIIRKIDPVADVLTLTMESAKKELTYEGGVYSSGIVQGIRTADNRMTLRLGIVPNDFYTLEDVVSMDVVRDTITIRDLVITSVGENGEITPFVENATIDASAARGAVLGLGESVTVNAQLYLSRFFPPLNTRFVSIDVACTYDLSLNGSSVEQYENGSFRWGVRDKDYEAALEAQARAEAEAQAREKERLRNEREVKQKLSGSGSHVARLYALTEFLDNKQIEAAEVALSARVALLMQTAKIPFCGDSDVFQKCRSLLGVELIDKNSDYYGVVRGATTESRLRMIVPEGKHGRTELTFHIIMYNFAYGNTNDPYAMLGMIYADINAADGTSREKWLVSGTQWTKVSSFFDQMTSLAEQAVRDAYGEAWGSNADAVAKILVDDMLLKLIDSKYGSFSNGVFTIMWSASSH